MSSLSRLFLIIAIYFCLVHPVQAITYYVSENFNALSALSESDHYLDDYGGKQTLSATGGVGSTKCLRVQYDVAGVNSGLAILADNHQAAWYGWDAKIVCGGGGCAGGAKYAKIFQGESNPYRTNMTFRLVYEDGNMEGIATGKSSVQQGDDDQQMYLDGTASEVTVDMNTGVVTYTGDYSGHKDDGWHHYDLYVKYNDDSTSNGEFQIWIDGVQKLWATNVAFRPNTADAGATWIDFGGYSSAPQFVSEFNIYFDNITITDTRIGASVSLSDFAGAGSFGGSF